MQMNNITFVRKNITIVRNVIVHFVRKRIVELLLKKKYNILLQKEVLL